MGQEQGRREGASAPATPLDVSLNTLEGSLIERTAVPQRENEEDRVGYRNVRSIDGRLQRQAGPARSRASWRAHGDHSHDG